MKQSLEPMIIAVNLCMNTEQKYLKAWKDAFYQAFKLVPGIDEMANLLAGSKSRHTTILRGLADLAVFGVSCTSNKAHIPAAMLLNT